MFASAAALFYARTFPDSSVGAVHRAPGEFPSGKQGEVLTVEFTVMGIPCLGLNGQVGGLLANHPDRVDQGVCQLRSLCSQAGVRCDDGDEEN